MKQIEVTNEMHDFLTKLSIELASQNHRGTAMPYFFQVQESKEQPTGEGMGETVWVLDGEIHLRTEEDIKKAVFEYKEWEIGNKEHEEDFDILMEYEIDEILEKNYNKFDVSVEKTLSNAFLTEKACKEHIKQNGYHYSEPRDYLSHAFRNPELEKVMEFILSITKNKGNTTES